MKIKKLFLRNNPWLWLLILSVLLKIGVVFFVSPMFFSAYPVGDASTYDKLGWEMAQQLRSQGSINVDEFWNVTHGLRIAVFSFIVALIYTVFGHHMIAVQLVGILVSSVGLYFFYKALKDSFRPKIGLIAFGLIALWPSITLWISLPLKEAWTFFFAGLMAYATVSAIQSKSVVPLIWLSVSLVSFLLLRPWLAILAAVTVIPFVFFVYFNHARKQKLWKMQAIGTAVILIALSGLIYFGMELSTKNSLFSLETVNQLRAVGDQGDSALNLHPYESWGDAFIHTPWGAITFLFRPFPWEAEDLFGWLATIENTVLLVLLLLSIPKWPALIKESFAWLPLVLLAFAVVGAFAIIGSNMGTLFRMKSQILPFLLILGSLGLFPFIEKIKKTTS